MKLNHYKWAWIGLSWLVRKWDSIGAVMIELLIGLNGELDKGAIFMGIFANWGRSYSKFISVEGRTFLLRQLV